MRYNTLLIDVDNTLLDFSKTEEYAFFKTAKEFNMENIPVIYKRYSKINDDLWKELEKGVYTRSQLAIIRFERLFSEFNLDLQPEVFNKIYLDNLQYGYFTMPNAVEFLTAVKDLGVKVYLVTNGVTKVQQNRLTGSNLIKFIDGICVSEQIGSPKPYVEFFKGAEELLGFKFNKSTLLIGDSLSSDVKGANNYNIDCCFYNPNNVTPPNDYKINYVVKDLMEIIDIIKV